MLKVNWFCSSGTATNDLHHVLLIAALQVSQPSRLQSTPYHLRKETDRLNDEAAPKFATRKTVQLKVAALAHNRASALLKKEIVDMLEGMSTLKTTPLKLSDLCIHARGKKAR